jgi:hypothetical protein
MKQPRIFLAIVTLLYLASCASSPLRYTFERASFAKQVGLPDCSISTPLSPSEVIEDSKRGGNPNPETNDEWIKIAADLQEGDKLRLVTCAGTKGYGGTAYYGLFRNNEIVLKFHPMILD